MYSLPRRASFRSVPSLCLRLAEQLQGIHAASLNQLGGLSEVLLVGSLEILDLSVMEGPDPRRDFVDDIVIVSHQQQCAGNC